LKVFVAQNASLTDVHWTMSGEIVLMVLVLLVKPAGLTGRAA
jgi:hypothetical protein